MQYIEMDDNTMDDYGAFSVISGIDVDLYILRGISQLVRVMCTALEKDENEPETFYPGIYAIHRQLDDFADHVEADCKVYFDNLAAAKAAKKSDNSMTDEEFLKALREHPERIPQVMQILMQGKQEVHPAG